MSFGKANGDCTPDCLIAQAVMGLSAGLVLAGPNGKVVWLNEAAAELLGAKRELALGRPLDHLLSEPQLAAFWQRAVVEDEDAVSDVTVHQPTTLELKVASSCCYDRSGALLGRVLFLYDVTGEREVQLRLSQAVANRLMSLTAGHMPPEPVANLTQQELRILRLVGRGIGNDEIADQTSISSSTVRSHLKSLYRKLHLASRSEAVGFAIRNHLV